MQIDLSADISEMFREPQCLERVRRAANFTEVLAALRTVTPR